MPTAAELLAQQPPARPDDPALRASIRRLRTENRRLLGVLDDDPTGSQAVHGVQVVTVPGERAYEDAFAASVAAATCFVLTNSRSLPERQAAALTTEVARGLLVAARRRHAPVDLISRSDSTLRGHVTAEVAALAAVRRQADGRAPDAVLFVPAFIEAGRLTAGDIHWARSGEDMVPVGETEFARDSVFGYADSDLRRFLAAKSGGAIGPQDVLSVGLDDIRAGGTWRVREVLAGARDQAWVVVNAAEYSDLEIVAHAVLLAEGAGQSFLFRTGPSFVRALAGLDPKPPLRGADLAPGRRPPGVESGRHGLVVVGSHTEQTTRQLGHLLATRPVQPVVLDVAAVMATSGDAMQTITDDVASGLRTADVVLYTSREVHHADGGADDLAVARAVSAALAGIVRDALPAGPAWIVAKGGITSHDVAVHGLGIRRAVVAGQLFPGLISVFRPQDAAPEAIGMPYVVFPGNVGDPRSLATVVALMHDATASR
jgi:uncharacterized protein YgbK (DUF1537 family)